MSEEGGCDKSGSPQIVRDRGEKDAQGQETQASGVKDLDKGIFTQYCVYHIHYWHRRRDRI